MKNQTNLSLTERISVIDALRGFALMGIVIVHFVEQYVGGPLPEGKYDMMIHHTGDMVVEALIQIFFRGKFFTIFSLLFGVSFFIQMNRAAQKGFNFRGRFVWRLVILFAIGYVHSLFYRGDILTIYAALGIFLIFFYNLNDKMLIIFSLTLVIGMPRVLLLLGHQQWGSENAVAIDNQSVVTYFEIITSGSLMEVFKINAIDGQVQKVGFQLGIFGRGYQTFALFLLGILLGRINFFEHYTNHLKLLRKILIGSVIFTVLGIAALSVVFATAGGRPNFYSWRMVIGLTIMDWVNLAMTAMIIVGFLLLYHKTFWHKILKGLTPYGRTALTNYVVQSLIGTFFLYGYGLGFFGYFGSSTMALFAIILFFLQGFVSKKWLQNFFYGPLEWLWRSATYMRIQPMVKKEKPLINS